jgi:hypothetical protein
MMREHEDVRVIRRLLAPPALPAVVGPASPNGAEHVATEDRGADVLDAARGEVIVGPRLAAGPPEHLLEGARRHEPVMQRLAAGAERVVDALFGARAEAVERDSEAVDA